MDFNKNQLSYNLPTLKERTRVLALGSSYLELSPRVALVFHPASTLNQQAYMDVLESSLEEVVSPFVHILLNQYPSLTANEMNIANLVREGKGSKQIGELLNLSKRSVDTYRNRIRKKLGTRNEKINLRTYLLSMA